MDFKGLLAKYKAGAVTDEERQIVENEIEKNEAINEYLSEQIIDAMPKIGESAPTPANMAESSKIRKRINRKLAGAVIASVAIVIAIFCAIQFAVFPFINSLYYNPLDGRSNVAGMNSWGQMSIDMSVFSELHMKGYETPFIFARPEGLGKYELTIYQYNNFRNYTETQYGSRIVRGKLDQSALGDAMTRGLGFSWVQSEYGEYADSARVLVVNRSSREELPRLPESAQVKAYLFFSENMDMQALSEFVKESSARVLWAGIKCSEHESLFDGRFGFSPLGKYIPLTKDAYDAEMYPLLELDDSEPFGGADRIDYDKLTASAYETHFTSMLRYMASKPDFMEVIGFTYDYAEALSYVESNGIWCQGVVVSGSRDEIIELAADSMVQHIAIDDVMVSVFSR